VRAPHSQAALLQTLVPWKLQPENNRKKRTRCPWPVLLTRLNSFISPPNALRGESTSRSFFTVIPGWLVSSLPDQGKSPTLVRLALPRPPNLDVQYQTMRWSCQEKIAKSS